MVDSASDEGGVSTPENSDDEGGEFGSEYSNSKHLEELQDDIDLSQEFEEQDTNFSDTDSCGETRDSFGFDRDHPECPDCMSGSGRKQGHVGRHTRVRQQTKVSTTK